MNLTKKLLSSALVCAMMAPMFTMNIFATSTTTPNGTADVSYDNTNEIPDPEHPTNPNWAVTIPSTIAFTDDAKKVNADLSIIAKNGGALPTDKDVKISVTSTNGFKLHLGSAGVDDLNYSIEYTKGDDSKLSLNSGMSNPSVEKDIDTFVKPGSLAPDKCKIKGEAVMQGTATKTGTHTDTLTYKVTVSASN